MSWELNYLSSASSWDFPIRFNCVITKVITIVKRPLLVSHKVLYTVQEQDGSKVNAVGAWGTVV